MTLDTSHAEGLPQFAYERKKTPTRKHPLTILTALLLTTVLSFGALSTNGAGHLLVVVRSCFWADTAEGQMLSEACEEAGGIFVNAGPLGQDGTNAAPSERSFTHTGVARHPGDKGMKALADAIVKALLDPQTKER